MGGLLTGRAAQGKRRRGHVVQVLLFRKRVLLDLQDRLRDGSWRPGVAWQHTIDDGKRRVISAAPFPDRIVHQVLSAAIGPLLDRHLIMHTYVLRVRPSLFAVES